MASTFSIVDDRDPSIVYTGTWVVGGTSHENGNTVSSSVKVGDHFSVPFTGTAIAVYGTFDSSSSGVQTSYSIDGGSATTVTSPSSGKDSYKQLFWQSDAISSGPHNLIVTMVAVNNVGDGEGTIWFDYFNITAPTTSTPSSGLTSGPSAELASGSSTPSSTSASSFPTISSTTVTHESLHAALIGGIVGGIALLIAFAIAVALLLRWKRRVDGLLGMSASNNPSSTQPFLSKPTPMTAMSSSAPSPAIYNLGSGGFDPRSSFARPSKMALNSALQAAHDSSASSSYAISASGSSTTSTSKYQNRAPPAGIGGSSMGTPSEYSDSIADLKRRQQQQVVNSYHEGVDSSAHHVPVQHVDSELASTAASPSELPPVYTPN
ncbi:Amidohydro-rel domain-containing protein [Mycena venus]|uniref:Amidohydro-rel domain-containing protein n=1 Tax=Mycena venus TaxID=2733690 RepID=A0A8H6X2C6_9AGAR|nr:Amidohydro-rel domain-containing protein [Mycena venus]